MADNRKPFHRLFFFFPFVQTLHINEISHILSFTSIPDQIKNIVVVLPVDSSNFTRLKTRQDITRLISKIKLVFFSATWKCDLSSFTSLRHLTLSLYSCNKLILPRHQLDLLNIDFEHNPLPVITHLSPARAKKIIARLPDDELIEDPVFVPPHIHLYFSFIIPPSLTSFPNVIHQNPIQPLFYHSEPFTFLNDKELSHIADFFVLNQLGVYNHLLETPVELDQITRLTSVILCNPEPLTPQSFSLPSSVRQLVLRNTRATKQQTFPSIRHLHMADSAFDARSMPDLESLEIQGDSLIVTPPAFFTGLTALTLTTTEFRKTYRLPLTLRRLMIRQKADIQVETVDPVRSCTNLTSLTFLVALILPSDWFTPLVHLKELQCNALTRLDFPTTLTRLHMFSIAEVNLSALTNLRVLHLPLGASAPCRLFSSSALRANIARGIVRCGARAWVTLGGSAPYNPWQEPEVPAPPAWGFCSMPPFQLVRASREHCAVIVRCGARVWVTLGAKPLT